jgi:hypothetical protein
MAATWTLARIETLCGCCGDDQHGPTRIPAGALVLELRLPGVSRPKYRCQVCGKHYRPFTDADLRQLPAPPIESPAPRVAAPVRRLRLVRAPQSWASLAESTTGLFDHAKAAAGDREET